MRVTRPIAVAWLCSLLLGGCAASEPYVHGRGPETKAKTETYVVRPQDTLYGIAWRHNLDYRELAQWNRLGADYRLTVGQVLILAPGAASSTGASTRSSSIQSSSTPPPKSKLQPPALSPSPPAPPRQASGPPSAGTAGGPAPTSGTAGHSAWVWPTDRLGAPRPVPGGGVLLLGRLGQDVRAAGTGRVVYTGSGLRGYGNLIIIKHGDSLLSSYAHNREMLVHEGEDVVAGQTIAHMGTGAHQVCALYFEIRLNGKPTDPLPYLNSSK